MSKKKWSENFILLNRWRISIVVSLMFIIACIISATGDNVHKETDAVSEEYEQKKNFKIIE